MRKFFKYKESFHYFFVNGRDSDECFDEVSRLGFGRLELEEIPEEELTSEIIVYLAKDYIADINFHSLSRFPGTFHQKLKDSGLTEEQQRKALMTFFETLIISVD